MSNFEFLFSSQNLGFRNWKNSDIDALHAINSDPDVMRYFPALLSREQTEAFLERMQKQFDNKGYCYFAVEHLLDRQVIGFIGLMWQDYVAPFTPCVDIGWRLNPLYWGKGYATEGAKACLNYAFDVLRLETIYSVATAVNLKSIHVMEKIGLSRRGEFIHPRLKDNECLRRCVYYSIDRRSFEAARTRN